ncbi:hypothetical protein GCM10029992_03130 [Glycomyces albus]
MRYQCHATRLCVVDPEHSAFFAGWRDADPAATVGRGSRIEGIGRPCVEPSFVPDLVDRMVKVDDAESIACLRWASERLGRPLGGSTGTNLVAALSIIAEMREAGRTGSVVTLLCDSGQRYGASYFDDEWLDEQGIDLEPARQRLAGLLPGGPSGAAAVVESIDMY